MFGQAIARHDKAPSASTATRDFEAETPAPESRENDIVPSKQHSMKEANIQPNGSSDVVGLSCVSMSVSVGVQRKMNMYSG